MPKSMSLFDDLCFMHPQAYVDWMGMYRQGKLRETAAIDLAGNAIHLPTLGTILIWIFSAVEWTSENLMREILDNDGFKGSQTQGYDNSPAASPSGTMRSCKSDLGGSRCPMDEPMGSAGPSGPTSKDILAANTDHRAMSGMVLAF